MKQIDLSDLSKTELTDLQKRIDARLVQLEDEKRAAALEAARKIAQDTGYTLEELLGGRVSVEKPKTKRAPSTIEYVDPRNPDNVWKGRGRPPSWFQSALDENISKDSMRRDI